MKILIWSALLVLISAGTRAQETLLSPEAFLGYPLGERFTPHHHTVDYFHHVARVLPNAKVFPYGETYEGRPLLYLAISSEENFSRLDEIRLNNLRRTGMADGQATADNIAIVWLSYNVHGNEASSMEAAMMTLYTLAKPSNGRIREWLKNTVVIIDPCINPDGRDRYANFYNQYGNRPPNPDPEALEHQEPWPGGRSNHYLFDLNRDWAWLTQVESQQRIKVYNQWMPHVHVDFHEQGHNNPYYFAPAAEPMHEVISQWQREFQVTIGKNNAKHFDENGWLYFTKEVFDLFYPSYGDTYPTYSGAIGMTYEQAGGGMGGLTVSTQAGDELTLQDRIIHHHTSALSTIETASAHASALTHEFEKYFLQNNTAPVATYKTYLIKGDNNHDQLLRLTRWMDSHGIRYGHPGSRKSTRGYNYQTQSVTPVSVSPEDLVVSVAQPKSRFITTVFEPESHLSDSLTYDITAWNLFYAYNLDAWALTDKILPNTPFRGAEKNTATSVTRPYAWFLRYEGLDDVSLLAALLKKDIRVRVAKKEFVANGETFARGTIIVTRRNNEHLDDLDSLVTSIAGTFNRRAWASATGFMDHGMDLGSADLSLIRQPVVAVLTGPQTNSLSAGEIWHFFEQEIGYPVTQLGTDNFNGVDIRKFDVLVVPDGSYEMFDDTTREKLSGWVNAGGRLILIANALTAFVEKNGFSLQHYLSEEDQQTAELRRQQLVEQEGLPRYDEAERKQLSETISGAIYKVKLDNSHPLGFGLRNVYYTLKTHESRYAYLQDGWNVARFGDHVKPVQGFAGFKANADLANSLLFGVEPKGNGKVVYLVDNPLFRNFWESGKMIFANAVFMVGE